MPRIVSIQEGTKTILSGDGTSGTITISSLTTVADAAVMVSFRYAGPGWRDFRSFLKVVLTNATTITWTRAQSNHATVLTLSWTVIEFHADDLVNIQVGTKNHSTDPSNVTLGTAVVLAQTLVTESFSTNQIEIDENELAHFLLSSTTNLRWDFSVAPSSGARFSSYQVIEFESAAAVLQVGTISTTNTQSSKTDTITSVDTAKTSVLGAGVLSNDAQFRWSIQRYVLTNATTVTLQKLGGAGQNCVAGYQVFEALDDDVAQHGTGQLAIGTLSAAPTFTGMDINKATILTSSYEGYYFPGNQNLVPHHFHLTLILDNTDPVTFVTIERPVSTTYVMNYAWFAHEWNGSASGLSIPQLVSHFMRPNPNPIRLL